MSVNDRSQRDLIKSFEKTNVDWTVIERQLLVWGNLLRVGKELRLRISINYIEDSDLSLSRASDKRGTTSVTKRMLTERDARIDAEYDSGKHSVWRDVYRIMRCPGPPCHHEGQYCWQDPVGKKHYKIRTHHLKILVKFVQGGGILETHDDVPEDVRQQLYAEEEQRLEKHEKGLNNSTTGINPPIINNIHVLPAQSSQTSPISTMANTNAVPSRTSQADPIDISGSFEAAIEEYTKWQLLRVSTEIFSDNIKKARDITLENCLDLQQIYEGIDPEFFVKQGVKFGIARRFVHDISTWVKERQGNNDPDRSLD